MARLAIPLHLLFLVLLLLRKNVKAFSSSASASSSSPSSSTTPSVGGGDRDRIIPVTVLSGFLGAGKTTLLRHLLENDDGLRIAVIVNDVASVNIDSKLVRRSSSSSPGIDDERGSSATARIRPASVIELQNGCACCSLSEELLSSVSQLLTLSDLRDPTEQFDHIVVEMSGVAEPRAVRSNFQDAAYYGMPLMERVRLDTLITVVDCSTFLDHLRSAREVEPEGAPDLFYRTEEERVEAERQRKQYEKDGVPPGLAEALGRSSAGFDAPGGTVCGLLVSQTEVADIVLLNKVDVAAGDVGGDERDETSAAVVDEVERVVRAFNPRATVLRTSFGRVDRIGDVLGVAGGRGAAEAGAVDDHRDAVAAALCDDPNCDDPAHGHSHSHTHGDLSSVKAEDCTDPNCDNPSHSHSHGHSHSHSHSHRSVDESDSDTHAGIGTYVYRARRPFHPRRLLSFLRRLPVARGILPPHDYDQHGDDDDWDALPVPERVRETLSCLLRSKGFCWTADSNVAALFWSHAGKSFEMQCLGRWWATLPTEQWPDEARATILADFDCPDHDEGSSDTVGDRRQEIVFIGTGLSQKARQDDICHTLNMCLLTDQEWATYRSIMSDELRLKGEFPNRMQVQMVSF